MKCLLEEYRFTALVQKKAYLSAKIRNTVLTSDKVLNVLVLDQFTSTKSNRLENGPTILKVHYFKDPLFGLGLVLGTGLRLGIR